MLTTAMSAMTGKAKGALGCRVGTPSVRATTVCHHMRRHQAATLNNKTQRRSEVTVVARGYPAYQEEPEQEPKRWPDEDFVEEVMEKFPDAGVADIEEGRVRPKTQDTQRRGGEGGLTPEGPMHHRSMIASCRAGAGLPPPTLRRLTSGLFFFFELLSPLLTQTSSRTMPPMPPPPPACLPAVGSLRDGLHVPRRQVEHRVRARRQDPSRGEHPPHRHHEEVGPERDPRGAGE